jgi:hypothetical protein
MKQTYLRLFHVGLSNDGGAEPWEHTNRGRGGRTDGRIYKADNISVEAEYLDFLDRFIYKLPISNIAEISQLGADMIYADRRSDMT